MAKLLVLLAFSVSLVLADDKSRAIQDGAILIPHPGSPGVPDSRLIAECLRNDQLSLQLQISYSPFRSGRVEFTLGSNTTCQDSTGITILTTDGSAVTSVGSPSVFAQAKDCGATDFFDTVSNRLTRWWNVRVQETYVEGRRERQLTSTVNVICQMTPQVPDGELNPFSPAPPLDVNNTDTILSPLHFTLTKVSSASAAVWMFRLETTDSFPRNGQYRIEDCEAVAEEDESITDDLIKTGCVKDSGTTVATASGVNHLTIKAFKFSEIPEATIYLRCTVKFCRLGSGTCPAVHAFDETDFCPNAEAPTTPEVATEVTTDGTTEEVVTEAPVSTEEPDETTTSEVVTEEPAEVTTEASIDETTEDTTEEPAGAKSHTSKPRTSRKPKRTTARIAARKAGAKLLRVRRSPSNLYPWIVQRN
ncbi:hypothetical protein RvY_14264 [Ramazzottius varieornatus]|uniref:ZP domain-containing protein n=1 Tax=Ramazzottius varieornatus TaxID=947166 RepID=A0A1D1VQN9_RAMVA|nr:hypothetical protein RvY_14264 [Ramazzottius varieornatus]